MEHRDERQRPRRIQHVDGGLIMLLAMALAVIGAVAWALTIRNDLEATRADLEAARLEVDQLRVQANATAYVLSPAAGAPEGASGTAFFTLDGTGVISVANLAPAPGGRSYQVWYYPSAEAEPLPGATFAVDETGTGFMLIPADVGLFTRITITLEPEAGSPTPTGPTILSGTTGGARG